MNVIDPRELSDRELFAQLVFGELPKRGWPRRDRMIVERLVVATALTAFLILVLAGVCAGIVALAAWLNALPR